MSQICKSGMARPLIRAGFIGCWAIALGATLPAIRLAAQDGEPRDSNTQTHSGTLLAIDEGMLTMTSDGQKEHTHQIVRDATISLNGEPASAEDLRKGDQIRVVTPPDGKTALSIEAVRVEPRTTAIGPRAVVAQVAEPAPSTRVGEPPAAPRAPVAPVQDDAAPPRVVKSPEDNDGLKRGMLGVFVGPGDFGAPGLRVVEVMDGGPAAKAGIREGDLIITFNQQTLDEPQRLASLVERQAAGDRVELTVARNGQRFKSTVTLAEAEDFDSEPQVRGFRGDENLDQAWLGVIVNENETPAADADAASSGAMVRRVYPTSPAWRAGIRDDDRIMSIDGQAIASAKDLFAALDGHKPGDELKFEIVREGAETPVTVDVKLARRGDFFGSQQATSDDDYDPVFDIPETTMRMEYERRLEEHDERIEGLLLEVLKELQGLKQDVNALKSGGAPARTTPE